jgi:hypothetical protein
MASPYNSLLFFSQLPALHCSVLAWGVFRIGEKYYGESLHWIFNLAMILLIPQQKEPGTSFG